MKILAILADQEKFLTSCATNQTDMTTNNSRRSFIKNTATFGAALPFLSPAMLFSSEKKTTIRLAFIGTGERGRSQLSVALNRTDIQVTALCDIDKAVLTKAEAMVTKAGQKKPALYSDGDYAFKELLNREDVDAVYIATPWLWHTPMGVAAMEAGKAVAMEVSGATDIQECWDLVDAQERTGVPFMFMENVCYRRDVMAVLNIVRKGMFGEMVHLEGGYQHDLRAVKLNDGLSAYGDGVEFGEKGYSESKWRTNHSVHRNAELYPTHGLGPVMTATDINRGNRLVYLTSMSSKSRGLHEYIMNHPKGGPNHPNAKVDFKLGDVVTTLIKTVNGETITLNHDTNLPRPYSLGFRFQGTKGLWMDINDSLYIEGESKPHTWQNDAEHMKQYDHPLWVKYGNDASGAGHGGMDFFVLHAFVEALKRETPMPIDVYDGATMMAITCLSEQSIAQGSEPVQIPDFTRGKWMNRKPIFALDNQY